MMLGSLSLPPFPPPLFDRRPSTESPMKHSNLHGRLLWGAPRRRVGLWSCFVSLQRRPGATNGGTACLGSLPRQPPTQALRSGAAAGGGSAGGASRRQHAPSQSQQCCRRDAAADTDTFVAAVCVCTLP